MIADTFVALGMWGAGGAVASVLFGLLFCSLCNTDEEGE